MNANPDAMRVTAKRMMANTGKEEPMISEKVLYRSYVEATLLATLLLATVL